MNFPHDKFAHEYDKQIEKYDCRIAEVVFGLTYGGINQGESLLDIGIGTGISANLFHQAGLRILGIDASKEMLSICKNKGIADEIIQQDILEMPWPYEQSSIEHVISCGVFHFIDRLDLIFAEIQRVQKVGGLLTFTVMLDSEQEGRQQQIIDGIPVFRHSEKYIKDLLKKFHYEKKKEIVCLVGESAFKVINAQKRRFQGK